MGAESTLGLELFLRFIFHILILFLPYVALIQFFWVGSIKKEEVEVILIFVSVEIPSLMIRIC